MCKFLYICVYWAVSVTMISLTIIAVDRYCVVTLTKRNIFKTHMLPYIIPLIWVAGFGFASPMLYSRHHLYYGGRAVCVEKWYAPFHPQQSRKHFIVVQFVFLYLIPFSAMAAMYSTIGMKLSKEIKSQRNKMISPDQKILIKTAQVDSNVDVKNNLSVTAKVKQLFSDKSIFISKNKDCAQFGFNKQRVIKMLVAIVIVFALCWLPVHVLQLIQTFIPYYKRCPGAIPNWAPYFAYFMYYGNGAINPVLYFVFNPTFRKGLQYMLRKWFRCNSGDSHSPKHICDGYTSHNHTGLSSSGDSQ